MKVRENYVSRQYHQVYFTFSVTEMKQLFEEVMTNRNISIKESKRKAKLITQLVMNKIEDEIIEEELYKLEFVPVCSRKYRYLTEVTKSSPLLVICQFCILPTDIQLKFPTKIPKEIFNIPHEDDVVKDFTNQILIMNNQYELKDVDVATIKSQVIYDLSYTKEDFVISELSDQIIYLDDEDQDERLLFLNSQVGDAIVLDNEDNVVVTAKVKQIQNQVTKKLTNKIVEEINFLGTKTISEFHDKILSIFTFSSTVVILLNYLADFVIQTGEIEFDEYVINHFIDTEFAPKNKKDIEAYLNEIKRELIKEYIIWVINFNYVDDEVYFMNRIIEEYEFEKILFNNPYRIDSYQKYINRHAFETRVLEYCLDHNIIDIEI